MRKLTNDEKERLWEQVRREFPDDEMMQEIHYVRLLHRCQTRRCSPKERVRFFAGSSARSET